LPKTHISLRISQRQDQFNRSSRRNSAGLACDALAGAAQRGAAQRSNEDGLVSGMFVIVA